MNAAHISALFPAEAGRYDPVDLAAPTWPMPMEILETRMSTFPVEEVWLTHRRLASAMPESREAIIRAVAMLYNIAMAEIKAGEREPGRPDTV